MLYAIGYNCTRTRKVTSDLSSSVLIRDVLGPTMRTSKHAYCRGIFIRITEHQTRGIILPTTLHPDFYPCSLNIPKHCLVSTEYIWYENSHYFLLKQLALFSDNSNCFSWAEICHFEISNHIINIRLLFPLLFHVHYVDVDVDGYNQLAHLKMNVHYLKN